MQFRVTGSHRIWIFAIRISLDMLNNFLGALRLFRFTLFPCLIFLYFFRLSFSFFLLLSYFCLFLCFPPSFLPFLLYQLLSRSLFVFVMFRVGRLIIYFRQFLLQNNSSGRRSGDLLLKYDTREGFQ